MAIVSSGLLETYTPGVSTQADQNIINQKVADNIESLRRFGIGIGDITSLHSHTAITADNFTLYKKAGFISFYQFNSSTGNIDGVFDGATLAEGDQFLLVNKASTPSTNTVTIALGSYSLLGSSDTSIVINSNSVYVYLVYIGSDKFVRVTHNTDILEQNNTWTGSNSFPSLILTDSVASIGMDTANNSDTKALTFFAGNNISHSSYIAIHGQDFGSGVSGDIHFITRDTGYLKFSTDEVERFGILLSGAIRCSSSLTFNSNNTHDIGDATNAPSDIFSVNAVTVTSDKNKKRNITDIDKDFAINIVRRIAQTAVKKYKWIDKDETQEIETIEVNETEDVEISDYEIVQENDKLVKKLVTKTIKRDKIELIPVYDENNKIVEYFKKPIKKTITKTITNKALRHKRFHDGFIAQEIESILKDLNIDKKDYPAFILIDENNNYSLRVTELLPYLFLAINDLYEKIDK